MKYKYWAIADLHFFHLNILSLRKEFSTLKQMNHQLICQWNKVVSEKDTIFIVGDFALGKSFEEKVLIKKLAGRKILILGNHDKRSLSFYEENFYFVASRIDFNKYIFTHEPLLPEQIDKCKINVHGHIHNLSHREDIKKTLCNKHLNVSAEVINYTPYFLLERRKK